MPVSLRRKKRMIPEADIKPPAEFYSIWRLVEAFRIDRDAPVDLWGCDKVVDLSAPKDVFEFQILVAAMLSSQTKDRYVKEGMDNLRLGDLSVGGVLSLTEEEIDGKIKMVGFHATKARNIRAAAKLIASEFNGRVPASFDSLISLPGVGPKMANLVMACAFNDSSGICVDTHVHRICSLLGWGCAHCKPICKQPEHTRVALEKWVPRDMWREFTYLLVGLGQQCQGSRQLVASRCMALPDPSSGLQLLEQLKFNFNGLDLDSSKS